MGHHTSSPPAGFLSLRGVQKTYDGQTLVIKDLNLDIARGEFLTLLGPSGSGKTTCLMMLAGFESVTSGEILLDGRPINRVPPHKRGIGMVFQNYALFPHMSVSENLAFPLEVRGMPKAVIAERVARALEMVELSGFGGRQPAQLSGGQQQRVAVARALVFEPALVLMDEPLGALDKQLREQMQYEIKRIHRETGVTIVYVTHDQGEALTLSDRIAVFRDGRIDQLDAPAALYERPQTAFVAQFIGENNALMARVIGTSAGRCTTVLGCGAMIEAVAVAPRAAGDPALLSVRPERVQIDPAPDTTVNRVPARVLDLAYHGDHLRLKLATASGAIIIAKVPNRPGLCPVDRGAEVVIGWPVQDCRALLPLE